VDAAGRIDRAERAWTIAGLAWIAAGLWVRYRRLAWAEFGRDQELLLLRAFEAQQTFGAAHGLRYSTGLFMPPFLLDLFALVLLVTHDPVRIAAFVATINVAGLALFHLFVRRLLGPRIALWTTVLLATMPWAVLRSRSVWVPDCLFPFVALALLALSFAGPPWKLGRTVAAAASLAILFQIHQPAWLLVPPLLLFAILFRVRVPARHLLVAAGVFALFYARWLAHEVGSRFDDVRWALHARTPVAGGAAQGGPEKALETVLWTLRQTGAGGLDYLSPKAGDPAWLLPVAPSIASIAIVAGIVATAAAVLLGVAHSAAVLRGRKDSPADRAVVVSTLVVVLVLAAYVIGRAAPRPHYAVLLQPFLALLVAWSLARWRADRAAIALSAVVGVFFAWRFEAGVEAFPRDQAARYGIPYALREPAWRERLSAGFDEVRHRAQRRSERSERFRSAFDASDAIVLRQPSLEGQGTITVTETAEGFEVRGGGPRNFLWLPAFEVPPGTVPSMRLDATLPVAADLVLGYGRIEDRAFAAAKVDVLKLPPGRNVLFAELRRPEPTERIAMRLEAFRATIHDLEIRGVATAPADGSRQVPREESREDR
jgi:hypothetical protein